jgi:hypothetical protein
VAGSQLLALWLTWRPDQGQAERDLAIKSAALLLAIAWTPFFAALATPEPIWKTNPATCLASPAFPRTSCPRLARPNDSTLAARPPAQPPGPAAAVRRLAQRALGVRHRPERRAALTNTATGSRGPSERTGSRPQAKASGPL